LIECFFEPSFEAGGAIGMENMMMGGTIKRALQFQPCV
jgi:hypothetical protein